MTFSVLGRCGRTGRLGIAVTSSSPAVAARCARVGAGIGVAASQNVTDPRLGPALLGELAGGASAQDAVDAIAATAPFAAHRQLAALDVAGRAAAWSGERTLGIHGTRTAEDCACAGNLLAGGTVLDAMATAFADTAELELEARLLGALAAGLAEGGEAGALHSAGLLVTGAVAWPVTDLRVDWTDDGAPGPVRALEDLWQRWAPQRDDYVTRALDPEAAPAYGVPGDPDP